MDATRHPASFVETILRLDQALEKLDAELWLAVQAVGKAKKATEALKSELKIVSSMDAQLPEAILPELKLMLAEAAAGAASLHIDRHRDRSADVSVSGRETFRLRPQLAGLVTVFLAAAEEDDGREGWRTTSELAAALGRQTGRAVAPRSMTRIVHRLRRAFRSARENSLLIQFRSPTEYRLALRRDPA